MTARRAIVIDRRQRLAAVALLVAVDLPQEAGPLARQWLAACKVCPGLKLGEVDLGGGRVALLTTARDLIDQMLGEAAQ